MTPQLRYANATPGRAPGLLACCVLAACLVAPLTGWAQAVPAAAPSAASGASAPWVAGLAPDRRPAGAPRLGAATPSPILKQQRLAGISQPWPGNVERIAEQGNWYSPMFAPGMPGRYDLRGLHARSGR